MATSDDTEQPYLDNISERIIEVFDRILSEVWARRDELLAQVDKMRNQFEPKNDSVLENIRGLEEMRTQVESMPIKQNLAMKKQQESLADIDSEIEKLKIALVDISNVKFNCSIDQLINQVKQTGKVCNGSSIESMYQSKRTAFGIMQKHTPRGSTIKLHIDRHKQLLYVYSDRATKDNPPVSIFNANNFTFIQKVGSIGNSASFLATGQDFIYIALTSYSGRYNPCTRVALYRHSDYSFVKELTDPKRICNIFNSPGDRIMILVCVHQNYKLCIYDRALNLEREVQLIYRWPSRISKTHCQLKDDKLYILLSKQLLVFNNEGHNIQTIFESEGKSTTILKNPTSFFICEFGYIIITDSGTDSIKFFTPEGELFHKIGEDMVGSDVVAGASDVVVYRDRLIVACYIEHPFYNNHPHLRIY